MQESRVKRNESGVALLQRKRDASAIMSHIEAGSYARDGNWSDEPRKSIYARICSTVLGQVVVFVMGEMGKQGTDTVGLRGKT